jgi:hypothetical protein
MGARGLLGENVVEVILVIRSAKNDFEGVGNKVVIKVNPISDIRPYDFATELFVFNKTAQPHHGGPFLAWRNSPFGVDRFYEAMKLSVQRAKNHLDPKRFESYSLRIPGASVMAAAENRGKLSHTRRYLVTKQKLHHRCLAA